ncbi:MAG: hypothetical protein QG597_1695 [Actinomycetota bacterium]|nr:hypothetical protein [Actinomycetota bacterium]
MPMMSLTISALFVFGLATWVCWRTYGMHTLHGLCAALFGFFVAQSGLAPAVSSLVARVFAWMATWHL